MILSRKQFLSLAGSAAVGMIGSDAMDDPSLSHRIETFLREYDQQGTHRTATEGDIKSAERLAERARDCGATPALESFPHNRVDPQRCQLEAAGKRIEGLPIFDAPSTDPKGIRGRLGAAGSEAEIGWVELPPNAEYLPNYESLRRDTGHRALVFVTKGGHPGLCPINASHFNQPYGPPVLQIGSEHGEWLRRQEATNAQAVVIAQAKRTTAQALNVTATIKGADARLAPLVVMTPRSGWWQSVSERGGGLVCWLEVLRTLAANKPARDVYFISSSGHELGHLGLQAYIARRPALVREAHAWIHFGANIGAKNAPNRIQAFDDELESLAIAVLGKVGQTVDDKAKRGAVPFGEAGNIHRGGGRYVSLLCPGNKLFHHPADRWPEAVDVTAIARYAKALADLVVTLSRG